MAIQRNTPQASSSDMATLQWANGTTQGRHSPKDRFASLVGFHMEVGKFAEADKLFVALQMQKVEIRHQRPAGQPAEVLSHWWLGSSILFHPITAGPPLTRVVQFNKKAEDVARAGIGFRWREGERSRVSVAGLLRLPNDQFLLVQIVTKSTMTQFLIDALLSHVAICIRADEMVNREKHPEIVALHEIALPLGEGEETAVGKGETTNIFPIASLHPEPLNVTLDYLRTGWRTETMHRYAEDAWESIVAWAHDFASGVTDTAMAGYAVE